MPDPRLTALIDTVVPEDEWPAASQTGVGEFVAEALRGDFAGAAPEFAAGLDRLDHAAQERHGTGFAQLGGADRAALFAEEAESDFGRTAVRLTMQGFLGNPGGDPAAAAWTMVGYRPLPDGAAWPPPVHDRPSLAGIETVRERYDAIVIGSGAGGGVTAGVLSEAGLRVLLVERGEWFEPADLRQDHLRSERLQTGRLANVDVPGQPRVAADGDVIDVTDLRYSNNASTVGGGTRVYGAQAWRFSAEDFRMASTYGVPEGSSLADWPISVDDLEPDYDRAEWEVGVSGTADGNRFAGPRRRGYPMPPLEPGSMLAPLARGATASGLTTSPLPLLINSVPYNGRGACIRCGACVGHHCPGDFKNDSRNTLIARAVASGNCDVLTGVEAERITTDGSGRVTGVALVGEVAGRIVRRQVTADEVLLGGGAVETPRLLLNSGLGNEHDQVGRNLQAHLYPGVLAVFDEPVQDCIGPGTVIATNDHRHGNPGIVGGALLANDFVPMPLFTYDLAVRLGAIPAWGAAAKQGIAHLYPRAAVITGPVQEVPNPESRVTVDPEVVDRFGVPVARLTGAVHPEDRRTAAFMRDRAVEWAEASGAVAVHSWLGVPDDGPSGGQHEAGTCRMGSDPTTSVTDEWGRVWGHDNLRIVDGSLHVTNGGVNPVLTILALAFRVSRKLVEDRA